MENQKRRILTVVGTRPELIRLSRVIPLLDKTFEHKLVHTGQNFDVNLSDVFFQELNIRKPDFQLTVGGKSLGETLGEVLVGIESVIAEFKPDAMLILGDTNSALAAIIAKRSGVIVYHMEAGNRSFDINVPEETNRKIVDSIADFNFPYTEHARRNLLAEGHHPRTLSVSGSPMKEVLGHFREEIESSSVLTTLDLEPDGFFLVSAHRQENVDSPERLKLLLDSISKLAEDYDLPCLVTTHPRLLARLDKMGGQAAYPRLTFLKPFGFFDYLKLQENSRCVLSDSGTISEEASILSFPAVTIRDSMERPEALEVGAVIMCGLGYEEISSAVAFQIAENQSVSVPADYLIENVSQRVVSFIQSTLGRHASWTGRRLVESQ